VTPPRTAPQTNSTPLEHAWWGQRCPIMVLRDTLRARPEKRAALTFLAAVWLRHRDRCTATRPA